MKKNYRCFMFLFSLAIIYFLAGCQGYGDTSTLYISKDCAENITNLYVKYGDGVRDIYDVQKETEEYKNITKKTIIKVGDITRTPVSVKCTFEKKPEANFKLWYGADIYYQKDKKWMHSHIPCGDSKTGCYSSKIEVKILSDEVSKLGNHFWAKRYFMASKPIPRPKFITEQND